MKIVHVVENLERGGLERVVIDLAAAQLRAGHDCLVICLFEKGALAGELEAHGVPVIACHKRGGVDLPAIRRLRSALRSHGAEVIHTHNAMAHYYTAIASRGLPLLRRLLNTRHSMSARAGSARSEWLYRCSMRVTDYSVAVCEAARAKLEREGVRPRLRLVGIPNGIHTELFAAAADADRTRLAEALGFEAGTRIIGTVGRLNRIKDQAALIRAFAHIAPQLPQTALVLVGDGPLRDSLQALAAETGAGDRIRFLGDRSDVRALLPGFELFALTSLSEGYSMALLEACASGLPIVATDVGGNGEIVRPGLNGRLIPPADPDALAKALLGLLSMPRTELARLGEAGREWALCEASFPRMIERYDRLYRHAPMDMAGEDSGNIATGTRRTEMNR